MKRTFSFIGFSSAITLLILNIIDYKYSKYLLISAAVLFIVSLLIKKIRQANVVPTVLGAALLSCLIFVFVCNNTLTPQLALDNQTVSVVFNIVDIPQKTDNGYTYIVKTKAVNKENAVQNIKLVLRTNKKIEADYYDDITAVLKLKRIADKPFESYGWYGDGVFMKTSLYGKYTVEKCDSKPLNYHIIKTREKLKSNLLNSLDEESGNLAVSLLIGDSSGLSNEIWSNFKICGATHLMAVSGLHTSVICLGLYLLLRRMGVPNVPSTCASLLLLLLYIGIADYSKSVIRAGIMIVVLLASRLVNRKADLLNSLGIAAFILCFNPFAVTDASAVLTVSAVLGIAVIKPKLDCFVTIKNSFVRYLLNNVILTISVLLSTLPAVWIFFKGVSLIGIVLNVILVFLAQIAIISSLILSLAWSIPIVSFIPKGIAFISTKAMIAITNFFAENFSFLAVDISNELFCIAIALCIAYCGISLIITNKIRLKHIFSFMLAVFFLASVLSIYAYNNTSFLRVTSGGCVIAYNKDCAVVIDADDSHDFYDVRDALYNKPMQNIAYINCDYSNKSLDELNDCESYIFYEEHLDIDLCSSIGVKYYGRDVQISMYDNKITVSDDFVKVNDYLAYRDVYGEFSDDRGYSFSFTKNDEFQLRRGNNG